MTEYISRGDFTSDIAFNRYKAVLVEYKNLKQLKKRVEEYLKTLIDSHERSQYSTYDDMKMQREEQIKLFQSILKGDTS